MILKKNNNKQNCEEVPGLVSIELGCHTMSFDALNLTYMDTASLILHKHHQPHFTRAPAIRFTIHSNNKHTLMYPSN